jgi:hypothetical protein
MPCLRYIPLALALAVVSCSANPGPQAMPDGTLEVECASEVSECVRRAESFCGDDPLEVIEAGSREGQHGDARYSDGARISTVNFVCGKGPSVAIHLRKKRDAHAPAPTPTTPTAPAPATVCQAGGTQACVGPGACSGGQTCLPDGSGWAACDCGNTTPPAAAGNTAGSASSSADSASDAD